MRLFCQAEMQGRKQPSQGQAYSAGITKTISEELQYVTVLQWYSEMSQVWQEGAGVVYFLF